MIGADVAAIVLGCVLLAELWRRLAPRKRLGGDRAWYRGTYLRSPHWRARRARSVRLAGGRCEYRWLGRRCRHRGALDVHHRTYKRLGHERDRDLLVLCRRHHDQLERAKR